MDSVRTHKVYDKWAMGGKEKNGLVCSQNMKSCKKKMTIVGISFFSPRKNVCTLIFA